MTSGYKFFCIEQEFFFFSIYVKQSNTPFSLSYSLCEYVRFWQKKRRLPRKLLQPVEHTNFLSLSHQALRLYLSIDLLNKYSISSIIANSTALVNSIFPFSRFFRIFSFF